MQRCTPAQVCTLDDVHTQPGRPPSAAAVSASMARALRAAGTVPTCPRTVGAGESRCAGTPRET